MTDDKDNKDAALDNPLKAASATKPRKIGTVVVRRERTMPTVQALPSKRYCTFKVVNKINRRDKKKWF